jgi:hypothetical protein
MEPGLISRDGWTIVDDSARPLFDASVITSKAANEYQKVHNFEVDLGYPSERITLRPSFQTLHLNPHFLFEVRKWSYDRVNASIHAVLKAQSTSWRLRPSG